MREILFRGKRVDNGEWVEGYYIKADHHWHNHGIHEDWIVARATQNGGWFTVQNRHAVIPDTVGQYTGLTDKNGKKIFEGDIVTAYNAMGECTHTATAVKWNDFFAEWSIGKCNGMYSDGSICSYEVIGNIHDNPGLIGGGENA